jgi:hypothetical protein
MGQTLPTSKPHVMTFGATCWSSDTADTKAPPLYIIFGGTSGIKLNLPKLPPAAIFKSGMYT